MKLEIFDKYTRKRVELIRTCNYATYTNDFFGQGKFELRIPTNDPCIEYLQFGTYIYFDEGIVGIVKGEKDTETSDFEVTICGYLLKHILTYRSFLLTTKYYEKPNVVVRNMVQDLFINPTDTKRIISSISLSNDLEYNPVIDANKHTYQNTGDTAFDVISEILKEYDCSFDLYPDISNNTSSAPDFESFEFRILKPVNRTINNPDHLNPIVFSFDLNNLSRIDYEEDGRAYNSVAIVASYGSGQERKIIEVGETQKIGIDRIELYVDARDLQPNMGVSEEWVEGYVDDQFGELVDGEY